MFVIPQSKYENVANARKRFLMNACEWSRRGIENCLSEINSSLEDSNRSNTNREYYQLLRTFFRKFIGDENNSWFYRNIINMPYDQMEGFWNEEFISAKELLKISEMIGDQHIIFSKKNSIKVMASPGKFVSNSPQRNRYDILLNYLDRCFPYYELARKDKKRYTGYDLCRDLDLNVCIYCNVNYTWTIEENVNGNSEKQTQLVRPEIDHYLPKSSFPIFQLSFENLIPCCNICNGKIKHDRLILPSTHLHPYQKSIPAIDFAFDLDGKVHLLPDDNSKLKSTLQFMKTPQIYEYYSRELEALWEKQQIYTPEYLAEILKLDGEIIHDRRKFLEHLFGYITEHDAVDRTLGDARNILTSHIMNQILKSWDKIDDKDNL